MFWERRITVSRVAGLSLVLLVIYLLTTLAVSVRDNRSSLSKFKQSLDVLTSANQTLSESNRRLAENNNNLLANNNRLQRDVAARDQAIQQLIIIEAEQDRRLREGGLEPVNPFDPTPSPTASPTRPGGVKPSPRPSPTKTASPRPSPSRAPPVVTVCVPVRPVPCVELPPRAAPATYRSGDTTVVTDLDIFNIDAATASRLLGLLVPFLVAVITKRYASSRLKAVLNFLSSVVVGSAAYLVAQDGGYDVRGFVNASLNTFLVSAAAYVALYKPSGATVPVADATRNFGLGSNQADLEQDLAASGEGIVGDR